MNTNTLHRTVIVTLALSAVLMFGAPRAATAQYKFFPNNATINYSLPFLSWSGEVVGFANQADWSAHSGGTSPTIAIVAGASIQAGEVFYVYYKSVVNMSGGSVPAFMLAADSSVVNISGGSVGSVVAEDSSFVKMTGGHVGEIGAYDTATVGVHGGKITGYLTALYGGTVNVHGGTVGPLTGYAGVAAGSTMNIHGGTFVSGQIIYVGIATDLVSGVPTMGKGTLNMYGSPLFTLKGTIPSLTIASTLSTPSGFEYTLQGTLSNGTDVTGLKVFVVTGSVFNLNW